MRRVSLIVACCLLASCAKAVTSPSGDDGGEMTGTFGSEISQVLFVDPVSTTRQRNELIEALKTRGNRAAARSLFEQYVAVIGANGVLQAIETVWPKCHSEAHDLGKIIFAKTKDIGTALAVCRDGCYSGCMHGVLMEAFAGARTSTSDDPEQHVDVGLVKKMMDDICAEKTMIQSYSPGDCAHATGHALMVLADYVAPRAIEYCDEFGTDAMRYYCATGAYMEYVTEEDAHDVELKRRPLYPCDVGKYPAACTRYKMVHVVRRLIKTLPDVAKLMRSCDELDRHNQIACYHGAGNAFMPVIAQRKITLSQVCGLTDDADLRYACIDGAMERMSKYHTTRANDVCETVSGTDRQTCDAAVRRGMYDMKKDLSLYLN